MATVLSCDRTVIWVHQDKIGSGCGFQKWLDGMTVKFPMSMPMPGVHFHVRVNVHFHFYFFVYFYVHVQVYALSLLTPLYTYTKNPQIGFTVTLFANLCHLIKTSQLYCCEDAETSLCPSFAGVPLNLKNNLADSIFFFTVPLNR
jgi:hypothetical protein